MQGKHIEVATQLTKEHIGMGNNRSGYTINEGTSMHGKHIEVTTQLTKEHLCMRNT